MFHHITVLKNEAVVGLNIKPDGIYVDCTLGGAGHSLSIVEQLGPNGRLIAFDQDQTALNNAQEMLAQYLDRVTFVKSNFRYIQEKLIELGIERIDGVLYDLGVSSPQLDTPERGFSYQHEAQLDMRMDDQATTTAFDVVNHWSEQELANVIYRYGEERFSRRIASRIVERRAEQPIQTTLELVDIIKAAIPAAARRTGPHPAKRTFQAIRIAVNDELTAFHDSLEAVVPCLNQGGRISVITFHSLEDRICKEFYNEKAKGCICPPGFPQCACGQEPILKVITRKPLLPSEEEIAFNPRARSAKLRVAEKR